MTKIDIEASSGNVFTDLGIPQPEEALLQADLALAIGRCISQEGWTPRQAAAALGVRQSDVSDILRGRLRDFPIERLIRLLRLLGQDVRAPVSEGQGGSAATSPP